MRSSHKLPRLAWIVAFAACSSPQQPFLGDYPATTTTNVTLDSPNSRCPKKTCPTTTGHPDIAVTAGPGSQIVLTLNAPDGGQGCVLTGTVQSGTAFTMDTQTSQGCQYVGDAGESVTTVVQSGSGTVDAQGNLSINQSGTVGYTTPNGGVTTNGTFQETLLGTRGEGS